MISENYFGYGLNTSRYIVKQKFGDGHKAHNTYLSIVFELGIIELIIYCFLYVSSLIICFNMKSKFCLFLFLIHYAIATMFLSKIEMPLLYVVLGSVSALYKRKNANFPSFSY